MPLVFWGGITFLVLPHSIYTSMVPVHEKCRGPFQPTAICICVCPGCPWCNCATPILQEAQLDALHVERYHPPPPSPAEGPNLHGSSAAMSYDGAGPDSLEACRKHAYGSHSSCCLMAAMCFVCVFHLVPFVPFVSFCPFVPFVPFVPFIPSVPVVQLRNFKLGGSADLCTWCTWC